MSPSVQVKNVIKTFSAGKKPLGKKSVVHAANRISSDMVQGEIFSIVGKSGCGKSTTMCPVSHPLTPGSGEIWFDGKQIFAMNENQMRPLRGDMQMIFQNPNGSLNPRMRIEDLAAEPLLVHTNFPAEERLQQVCELLGIVGLSAKYARCCPHEFSGGQRQRTGIVRTLMVRPKLIIADEPASSLNVSIQAQVSSLMQRLQAELQLTYLFISYDLSVVEMISDRTAVMYLGCITKTAPRAELYSNPRHPYIKALLSAVPVPDPATKRGRVLLQGDTSSAVHLSEGCLFHVRCPPCTDICRQQILEPQGLGDGHVIACHHI